MNKFLLFLLGSAFLCLPSYGQLDCVRTYPFPSHYDKGVNHWMGYVYQLPSNFTGSSGQKEFDNESGAVFKGFLPYNTPGFLPLNDYNFDINFNDTGWETTDNNFFSTIYNAKVPSDLTPSCDVQLKYFGVVLRSQIRIHQPGIYKITIGSDDGSFLKDQYGIIHDNWGPGKIYNYETVNYYKEYTMNPNGDTWAHFDLSYYEIDRNNRLSFNFELYFGPGEIDGSQSVCGIAPDPAPFGSRGPAVFEEGGAENITYQWQYSETNDESSVWEDIDGANGLTYDIPKYGTGTTNWRGTRYFRRMAVLTIGDVVTVTASNVVEATITIPDGIATWDQQEFGDNFWIGHVYRGKGVFSNDNYAGRIYSDGDNLSHGFGSNPNDSATYPLDAGCSIVTTNFSVRYRMKFDVDPDTYYIFKVEGDDGFRLSMEGEQVIDKWEGSPDVGTFEYFSNEAGKIDLELDYYENRFANFISFSYESRILPLEWGRVSAEACGPDNCLTWETIQEKNTSHFELERSYNGADWEMFDSSVQAQGNSTAMYTYHFTDKRVMASKIYYRIRQVDLDEAYEYSEVMRVDNPHYVKSFLPYPNPTMDKIRIFSQAAVVAVSLVSNDYSVFRSVNSTRLHDNRYEIDLAGLKPGNYVVMVQKEGGETETFKVIKK